MSWTLENACASALHNQDILLNIFEHLDPQIEITDPPQRNGIQLQEECTRTLAGAARVCRAFLDPALDILWRSLNDVSILLRLALNLEYSSATSSGSWVRKIPSLAVSHFPDNVIMLGPVRTKLFRRFFPFSAVRQTNPGAGDS